MSGNTLESLGWRQGSVVRNEDIAKLFPDQFPFNGTDVVIIVASQSCDIAHPKLENEPYIEVSLGRMIRKKEGQFANNYNPRRLHTVLQVNDGNGSINKQAIELRAFERFSVPKKSFFGLIPDAHRLWSSDDLRGYVAWLAARYKRFALPTAFNDRIREVDPKRKVMDKFLADADRYFSAIYVQILPETELPKDVPYAVNLLGLLDSDFSENKADAEAVLNDFKTLLGAAGMDVTAAVRYKKQVSLDLMDSFERFSYDYISFQNDSSFPPDWGNY